MAFGCQLPERSGLPSAVRGVGPAGGQFGSPPRPGPAPRPRPPPRPSCATSPLDVESPATIAAAITKVNVLTINVTPAPVSTEESQCTPTLNLEPLGPMAW